MVAMIGSGFLSGCVPVRSGSTRHLFDSAYSRPLTGLSFAALTCVFVSAQSPDAHAGRKISLRAEPIAQSQSTPRTILVSIRRQRLRLFDGNREIASSRVSSGMSGFDTPTGVFSILEKKVYHESNIYEGAPMPFMQRITWSGIALHAGVVPGYRASHGCIRLPYSFAKSFFGNTDVGGRVIITQDEVQPVAFQHDTLFRPLPENDPVPAPTQGATAVTHRVAANDTTADGKAALDTLVAGAAMANAAEPAPAQSPALPSDPNAKPRSRAEALRMLTAKLERLNTAMTAAEAKKAAASETAKAALRAAQEAEAKYASVRQPYEGVLRTAAAAESARAAAAQAYRSFLTRGPAPLLQEQPAPQTRNGRKGGVKTVAAPQPPVSPEDREFELEERLLDATVDADAARTSAAQGELVIADAKAAFNVADAAKAKAIAEVQQAIVELRTAQKDLIDARAEMVRRNKQLSIFISLKTEKIYIRQGFEPVLEAPIQVDEPPGAIGTHVLTAMNYDQTGNNFVWQLVSAQQPRLAPGIADAAANDRKKRRQQQASSVSPNSPMNIEAARVALDSIRIPQEITDKIAELAKPGTSLIISEKDLSRETGKGTEFVVLTR